MPPTATLRIEEGVEILAWSGARLQLERGHHDANTQSHQNVQSLPGQRRKARQLALEHRAGTHPINRKPDDCSGQLGKTLQTPGECAGVGVGQAQHLTQAEGRDAQNK